MKTLARTLLRLVLATLVVVWALGFPSPFLTGSYAGLAEAEAVIPSALLCVAVGAFALLSYDFLEGSVVRRALGAVAVGFLLCGALVLVGLLLSGAFDHETGRGVYGQVVTLVYAALAVWPTVRLLHGGAAARAPEASACTEVA